LNAVWVIAEQDAGGIRDASLEVIGEGRALADALRNRLHVIVLGNELDHLLDPLTRQDVDAVYLVSHTLLSQYTTDAYVNALEQLLASAVPAALLISATAQGSDLAPRLAARLNVPIWSMRASGSKRDRLETYAWSSPSTRTALTAL
jgi:electron transfer flavoprotein alpha subunit